MSLRRLIPRLLLCLAAGFITSLLLAWLLASIPIRANRFYFQNNESDPSGVEYYSSHAQGARRCVLAGPDLTRQGLAQAPYNAQEVADWAAQRLDVLTRGHVFPEWWGQPPDQAHIPAGSLWAGAIQDARGWPMLALWCEWPIAVSPPPPPAPGAIAFQSFGRLQPPRGGLELPPSHSYWGYPADELRALPCRPIWRGLAVDTVFFALPWFVVIPLSTLTFRAIRGRWRRSRNLCPDCAYNLAGLPPDSPCPECGAEPL